MEYISERTLVDLMYAYEDIGQFIGAYRTYLKNSPLESMKLRDLMDWSPKMNRVYNRPFTAAITATPKDSFAEFVFGGSSVNTGITLGEAFDRFALAAKRFPTSESVYTHAPINKSFIDLFFPGLSPTSILKFKIDSIRSPLYEDVLMLFTYKGTVFKNTAIMTAIDISCNSAERKVLALRSEDRDSAEYTKAFYQWKLVFETMFTVSMMYGAAIALLLFGTPVERHATFDKLYS